MKTKILIFAAMLFITSMAMSQAVGDKFNAGNLKYQITSLSPNTVEVYSYLKQTSSATTSVEIPEKVTNNGAEFSVTSIGKNAFSSSYFLVSISVPSSIKNIGETAFEDSRLESINIPSSVTSIEKYAFRGCGIKSIIIPSSVTNFAEGIFQNCTKLTSVNLPNTLSNINNSTFSGCTNLTSIAIPSSVTSIGERVFEGCTKLTSVNLPNTLSNINNSTFYGCTNLTSIAIPSSVTSIGESAFYKSGLTSVTIPNLVTSIKSSAFEECTRLKSLSLPSSIVSIGNSAFKKCYDLTSVTCKVPDPSNITMGSDVFSYFVANTTYKLFVPLGSKNKYASNSNWRFTTIDEIKQDQTITFSQADTTFQTGLKIQLTASINSNLPISYELVSGDGVINGAELTINSAGEFKVKATQAGNDSYNAANPITVTFNVKQNQTITFSQADITFQTNLKINLNATASSNLSVSYELLSGEGTISGNVLSINKVGKYKIKATQAGNNIYNVATKSITFNVNKATQTITFEQSDIGPEAGLSIKLSATSSANLTVAYELISGDGIVNGNVLKVNKIGAFKVKATQAGNENINAASPVSVTFNVSKQNQSITFVQADTTYQDGLKLELKATASSNLTITYELVSGDGSINGNILTVNKAGEFKIKAKQAGDDNFNAADEKTVTFNVQNAPKALGLGDEVKLSVYPNPAIRTVTIKLDKITDVYFYNLNGKLVLTGKTNTTINVEFLEKGIYMIVIGGQSIKMVKR